MDQCKGRNALTRGGLNADDFVSWSEFRLLLAYLRVYFELFIMFTVVDGGARGDRGISLEEFTKAAPLVEEWGKAEKLKIADPVAAFNEIDEDGSGAIRFDELCDSAAARTHACSRRLFPLLPPGSVPHSLALAALTGHFSSAWTCRTMTTATRVYSKQSDGAAAHADTPERKRSEARDPASEESQEGARVRLEHV
eukprot:6608539-Prymnesium_polylepis.1